MSKLFWSVAFVLTFTVFAEAYRAPSGGLKDELRELMAKGHHSVSYRRAREILLGRVHLEESQGRYFIKDVYCEKEFGSRDFPSDPPGPGLIPKETILNTEHTWPQSRFPSGFRKDLLKSDMHHLYPSDNQLNSIRGNNRFGEVSSPDRELKCPQSRIGRDGRGNWIFEPPRGHRGNVARALFYFSVRYEIGIGAEEEAALRKWHLDDPVDEFESYRNGEIEKAQGNRNVFIDRPELVNQISDF